MRKLDILRFAMGNFLRRKARSALTVLGVIIGTAAVVVMMSIGIGMNKGFEDQISEWGDLREITVHERYGTWDEETGEYTENAARTPLDDIALEEIRQVEGVMAASPRQWSNSVSCLLKDRTQKKYNVELYGIDASSMADFGYEVLYGRLLDERDVGTTNFVMCYNVPFTFSPVHASWEERIYWYESTAEDTELPFNPVDDRIKYEFSWNYGEGDQAVDTTKPRIINQEGKCVGVLVQNLNRAGYDYDSYIYMDIKGMQEMDKKLSENQEKYYQSEYGESSSGGGIMIWGYGVEVDGGATTADGRKSMYQNLTVMVEDTDHVLNVQKAIEEMGYEVYSDMDYLEQMQEQTKFLRSILGAIGVVAFFVAAISIANTMVMSIYERTREIGIMKVIGCKLKDIRSMFLIEAAIIGIVGGVLGVGLSYVVSMTVNKLAAEGGMSMMGIDASSSRLSIIPFWLDIAALILATAVGVVSGLYPAIRATMLSALEAIKNE